ncbi:hypothetical protein NC652_016190 [Populus alba x Populus x berolinensis]|nr:hypothetical protein NC652_016190 [Populus alba x Populus x berolinensis]
MSFQFNHSRLRRRLLLFFEAGYHHWMIDMFHLGGDRRTKIASPRQDMHASFSLKLGQLIPMSANYPLFRLEPYCDPGQAKFIITAGLKSGNCSLNIICC